MSNASLQLPNIPQGWYMHFDLFTQSGANTCVTLKDSAKTYIDNACQQSTSPVPPLAQGFVQVEGTDVQLEVASSSSSNLQFRLEPVQVNHPQTQELIATGYVVFMEDWTDNDFNDLSGAILAWKTRG